MPRRPCLTCGALSTSSYCPAHTRSRPRRHEPDYRKGYSDPEYRRIRERVKQTYLGSPCPVCREPMVGRHAPTVEHLVPLSQGGDPADPMNLAVMCKPCNSGKKGRV